MNRPPGPKPHFPIGNMPLASPDPLGKFLTWAREYGDIFYYRAAWLHVYFLNEPELIEWVLDRRNTDSAKLAEYLETFPRSGLPFPQDLALRAMLFTIR